MKAIVRFSGVAWPWPRATEPPTTTRTRAKLARTAYARFIDTPFAKRDRRSGALRNQRVVLRSSAMSAPAAPQSRVLSADFFPEGGRMSSNRYVACREFVRTALGILVVGPF